MTLTSHHDTIAARPRAGAACGGDRIRRIRPRGLIRVHAAPRRRPRRARTAAPTREADADEHQLKGVGVGHRPHPAGHRVERDDRRGDHDAGGRGRDRARRRTSSRARPAAPRSRTSPPAPPAAPAPPPTSAPKRASNGSISVWNSSARMRRAKNRPPRIRLMPKHTPPCRPLARLDAVDAFGGAEQVAAVHPRRGHGERRQPQRHRPAGDHEVVGACRARPRPWRGTPASRSPMNDAYIRPIVEQRHGERRCAWATRILRCFT